MATASLTSGRKAAFFNSRSNTRNGEPGDTALVPVAVDGQFQPARQRFEEVDSCIETADVADQIAAEHGVIRLKFFRFP